MKQPFTLDRDHVVLPKGTRVVLQENVTARDGATCKPGTIAQVSEVDHPRYTVTTPSGRVMDCDRAALVIQRQRVRALAERRSWNWEQLKDHVVLAVVVGSQAWNLADASSDTDVKGAWLLPFDAASGLWEPPDEIHEPGTDAQYWEVEKMIRQGLRADANTLETLWSPKVLHQDEVGALLRDSRDIFVSKHIYRSFGRYAISQFDKIRQKLDHARIEEELITLVAADRDITADALIAALAERPLCANRGQARKALGRLSDSLFDRGLTPSRNIAGALTWLRAQAPSALDDRQEYRPKNAYNLLRLLHSGIQWMRDGEPLIAIEAGRPDGLRERLLDVKHGRVPIEEVMEEAHALAKDFERVWEHSDLPEEPDLEAADALLRACRERAACNHFSLDWTPLA